MFSRFPPSLQISPGKNRKRHAVEEEKGEDEEESITYLTCTLRFTLPNDQHKSHQFALVFFSKLPSIEKSRVSQALRNL